MIAKLEDPKALFKFEKDVLSRTVEETHVKKGMSEIYQF